MVCQKTTGESGMRKYLIALPIAMLVMYNLGALAKAHGMLPVGVLLICGGYACGVVMTWVCFKKVK